MSHAAGPDAAALWRERDYALDWASGDDLRELLRLPRAIAAALVAVERAPAVVVDIASGPGDFLAAFLDAFPGAQGVWTDVSEPMRELARERLDRFGDRVEYRLADMTDLAAADLPTGVDVVLTSRASHHLLDLEVLRRFYRQAAALLAPGGWLVNLDHTRHAADWDARLRAARGLMRHRPEREGNPERYGGPQPTLDDHVAAITAAGLEQPEIAWKAFVTSLIVARRGEP